MDPRSHGKPATAANVRFLPPSYALRDKAPLTNIDLETIVAKGTEVLKAMQEEYLGVFETEHTDLSEACVQVERTHGAAEAVALLQARAQEVRGHSGSVGLDPIWRVCDSLCAFLLGRDTLPARGVSIARLHVDALDVIMRDHAAGDDTADPDLGEVFGELDKVVARFDARHPRPDAPPRGESLSQSN